LRSALYSAEALERRVFLAGYFDGIADFVTATTQPNTQPAVPGVMKQITNALRSAGSIADRIPLINKPARDLTQFTDSLESFRTALDAKLRSFTEGAAASFIQGQLFGALNPLGVVGDRNNSGSITSDDIAVAVSGLNVDVVFDVAKSFTFDSAFGLGMDAIPFKPATPQNGGFTAGFTYRNFNFGIQGGVPYFRTNNADEIEFKLLGNLPATQFTAGLGFLNVGAQDGTPGVTDLNVTLRGDVTPSFGLANFRIDGALNLLLNVEASLNNPGLPRFKTGFKFDWNFPTINLSGGLESGSFGIPSLSFQNVQMNLGSVLNSIVGPIAKRVQYITAPFQPIFDLTKKPIPGLNDLSQSFGGPTVTPLFLSNAFDQLPPAQQTESLKNLSNIIQSAEKLRWFGETVNNLASAAGGNAWLNLGNFNIAGPTGGSLFDAAASTLGNPVNVDWSQLQAIVSGGTINFDAIKAQTLSLLGPGLGNEVNQIWSALEGESLGNGITYDFPIIKDPARVALGMLLGRDSDMVTLTGRFTIGMDKVFNLVPVPGVIVGVGAVATFSAYAKIGYDTRGLREAISPMYGGGSFDPNKLLRGFWIDKDTRADATGRITLALGVGVPGVVTATVEGGLQADLHAAIANPQNQAKIRPFVTSPQPHLSQYLFTANGTIQARAFFRFKAGVTILGKHIGVDILKNFANVTLLNFDVGGVDGGNVPIPADLTEASIPPAVLGLQSGTTLTLFVGTQAGSRGSANSGEAREYFEISRVSSRINLGGFWATRPSDTIEVRAFGFTQAFTGVRRVQADFGSQDDVLVIHDTRNLNFFKIQYDINGGDGNDKIVMDGEADVTLRGGSGNDTLDGGRGDNSIYLYGDAGFDTITFAQGRLDQLNASTDFIFLYGGADGGTLSLDNSASPDRWLYYFTPPAGPNPWVITVAPGLNNPAVDTRFVRYDNLSLALTAGPNADTFSGAPPANTTIFGGAGDDDYFLADANNASVLQNINWSFSFYPGEGFDRLLAYNQGYAGNDRAITLDNGSLAWGTLGARIDLGMGDLEQSFIQQGPNSPVNVAGWSDKPVTVIGGSSLRLATGWVGWNAQITASNVGAFVIDDDQHGSPYNQVGVDLTGIYRVGDNEVLPDPNNPGSFIVGPNKLRTTIAMAANTSSVTLNGRLTQNVLDVDVRLGDLGRPFQVNYNGRPGVSNTLRLTDPSGIGRTYELNSGQAYALGGLSVVHANLASLEVNAGGGNDTFNVRRMPDNSFSLVNGGGGDDAFYYQRNLVFGFTGTTFFDGQAGSDSIEVDDRLNTLPAIVYDFSDGIGFIGSSGVGVDPQTTESRIWRGSTFVGATYKLTYLNGDWDIRAGNGDDSFQFRDRSFDFGGLASYHASIDGGAGYDTLQWRYRYEFGLNALHIADDRFVVRNGSIDYATFSYTGIDNLLYLGAEDGSAPSQIFVDSTPVGVGLTVQGFDRAEKVFVGNGTATPGDIRGPFIVDLGTQPVGELDSLFYDDAESTTDGAWTLTSGQLLRDGNPVASFGGVEQLGAYLGSGDDDVTLTPMVTPFKSLIVTPGGGANTVAIGDGISMPAGIGDSIQIGGEGGSTAVTYNATPVFGTREDFAIGQASFTHQRSVGGSVFPVASVSFGNLAQLRILTSAIQTYLTLNGTAGAQQLLIESGGNDALNLSLGTSRSAFSRSFVFAGSGVNDTVYVDASQRTNAVAHFTASGALGAVAGDNLFEPAVYFALAGYTEFNAGFGAHATLYAAPSAIAPVSFFAPGVNSGSTDDFIGVALADVADPVFTPGFNGGTWTSASHFPLSFTGFDVAQSDAVRPEPVASTYDFDAPSPGVSVTFSEDVGASLALGNFILTNTITGNVIPASELQLEWNAATNAARIAYAPSGVVRPLPDGRYNLSLGVNAYADLFWNAGTTPISLDFFVFAADANRDASVNFDDLLVLASNYNQSSRSFSQGDFTYDGVVNFDDLLILASRYNQTLPTPGLLPLTAPPLRVMGDPSPDADRGDEGSLSGVILQ
jgi:hypothetical protein